jgi:hypothetical protein
MRLNHRNYVLIRHSMGAKVAQAIAGRKSVDRLAGIVLLYPAPLTARVETEVSVNIPGAKLIVLEEVGHLVSCRQIIAQGGPLLQFSMGRPGGTP